MRYHKGLLVKLNKRIAKWHLEHPDIYYRGGELRSEDVELYERETLMHLMSCMGVPMIGRIVRPGNDCWLVKFRIGNLTTSYFVDSEDIEAAT